jgi:flagellar motor switch protein FliG
VADILRACGGHSSFLDDLRARRPDLAEEINRQLFVFDDVARLEDRALQGVLKGIDRRKLALALKDAREPTREKVLGNLSRRAVEAVSAELDSLGPVKLAEVEAARDEIVATILRLEERGEIFIAGRGREENRIVY